MLYPSQDQLAKWYSAGISNPSRDEGMGSRCAKKKKKITGRHLGVMTWVWPGPLRVSEVQGRNTCYKGGFSSENSLFSSSPMSFYLLEIEDQQLPTYLAACSQDGWDSWWWKRPASLHDKGLTYYHAT